MILDPGIGFGKTLEHNLDLLHSLDAIVDLGFPCPVRGLAQAVHWDHHRRPGGEGAHLRHGGDNVLAYERGATFFRVHDVRANREALAVAEAVRRGSSPRR